MCGIAAIAHYGRIPDAAARCESMAQTLRHRGPDGEGRWSDHDIALGFRRLAILDLDGGNQPMCNEDATVWVVFNGEIYNHRALRAELVKCGHRFASDHSDTEVLVHAWEEFGAEFVNRLNGMFAFVLWDAGSRTLVAARDRVGIKPLYVSRAGDGSMLFASEVRAIFASGLVKKRMSQTGVMEYLSFQNYWGGRTPFENVRMLEPGSCMVVTPAGVSESKYWDISVSRTRDGTLQQESERYRDTVLGSLTRQLDADVDVMSYLSGGIDSSAVTAGAYRLDHSVRAYSCIFNLDNVGVDRFVDEREYSRAVAKHLGIERVELEITPLALSETLDETIAALEYPRMGMSYVNFLIARRVAEDSKVVLSGLGGDEFSGGYFGRYNILQRFRKRVWGLDWWRRRRSADWRDVLRQQLNYPVTIAQQGAALTPEFLQASSGFNPAALIDEEICRGNYNDPWDVMMNADARTYLHGLLVMEDKISMRHSLETRVPLLDNELIDLNLRLPWRFLCDAERGKIVFREAVRDWVPDDIYRKPKMGFAPPDASWYRWDLQPWIRSRLSDRTIKSRGIFQPSYVKNILEQHFSGQANHLTVIWSMLCLESWFDLHGF